MPAPGRRSSHRPSGSTTDSVLGRLARRSRCTSSPKACAGVPSARSTLPGEHAPRPDGDHHPGAPAATATRSESCSRREPAPSPASPTPRTGSDPHRRWWPVPEPPPTARPAARRCRSPPPSGPERHAGRPPGRSRVRSAASGWGEFLSRRVTDCRGARPPRSAAAAGRYPAAAPPVRSPGARCPRSGPLRRWSTVRSSRATRSRHSGSRSSTVAPGDGRAPVLRLDPARSAAPRARARGPAPASRQAAERRGGSGSVPTPGRRARSPRRAPPPAGAPGVRGHEAEPAVGTRADRGRALGARRR